MELKEGMYVRINNNLRKISIGIGKIKQKNQETIYVEMGNELPISFDKNEIANSSYNIIDLIDYEDVVKIIYDGKEFICKVVNVLGTKGVQINLNYSISLNATKIKSILTKEQYSSMAYKIGDE